MIGVFDSGLGGLSVLAAISRALPHSDLLYLADTAHVPYGEKSDAYIRERVLRTQDAQEGPKAFVEKRKPNWQCR